MTWNRQRTYATLVGLGIWILLGKTIVMTAGGSLATFVPVVAALLALEFLLDVGVFLTAIRWWIGGTVARARLPLRLTAAAVVVHAIRVAIYVLGRTGPWHDFDLRPAFRTGPTAEWPWVIFAGAASAVSLVALFVVWRAIRRRAPAHADPTRVTA
jgi:hypothetical protein